MENGHDSNNSQVTLPTVAILTLIFALMALSYVTLDRSKLERSVFEEHNRAIVGMSEDIRAMRLLMDQHSIRPIPPGR